MTFHFPYMQILNLKEKEKEQAQAALGQIQRQKEALLEEYHSLEGTRNQFLHQMETSKKQTSIAAIQQRQEYLHYLDRKMFQVEEQMTKLDQEISQKKLELLHKQKDEKTWNHLREKSFEKYVRKQKKIEQDLMDEMAAIRHFHQRVSI